MNQLLDSSGEIFAEPVKIGGNNYSVRPLNIADTRNLCALDKLCFSENRCFTEGYFFLLFLQNGAFGWSLAKGEKLAAFILLTRQNPLANIATIDVHPDFRRRGLACYLLRLAERKLKATGTNGCTLQVAVSNLAAVKLYEKLGYSTASVLDSYYGNRENAYLMEKIFT